METSTETVVTYAITTENGHGLSMSNFKSGDTVQFRVMASDGVVAWRGPNYFVPENSRVLAGYRLAASRAKTSLETYLKRTGKRWEIEQQLQRAEKKRQERIAVLERIIPKYQAELDALRAVTP